MTTPKVYKAEHSSGLFGVAVKVGNKWTIKTISVNPPENLKDRARVSVKWHWWDKDWELLDEAGYTPSMCVKFQKDAEYLSKFASVVSADEN